jgi:pimeloyl-ACP methyl ester carboxylesterase
MEMKSRLQPFLGNGLLWRFTRIILLVSLVLLILIMAFEDKLIYFPAKYPDGLWTVDHSGAREGEIVPQIEDVRFSTSDGVMLHAWHSTPLRWEAGTGVPVAADMVLLWFHGNAGNLTYRYDMMRALMALPVRVVIVDYRGYGKSEGSPSERGLYLDARAAWDYLVLERRIAANRIVIFGKSLGGVPAIDLATHVQPAGLIVQSSFTSARDMAASVLPFLPTFLLRTKMDSFSKIPEVSCPKLFIHSRADEVVPWELGRKLYEAATEPKEFYEVIGSPHNSTYIVGGKPYLEALRSFVEACRQRTDAGL